MKQTSLLRDLPIEQPDGLTIFLPESWVSGASQEDVCEKVSGRVYISMTDFDESVKSFSYYFW